MILWCVFFFKYGEDAIELELARAGGDFLRIAHDSARLGDSEAHFFKGKLF